MKNKFLFLLLIGLSLVILFENAYAQDPKTFEIDGFTIISDNLHVKEIILDWDSPHLPEGEIILDEAINGTVTIQIPKNMPRTMNLDFGSTLVPIRDQRTNIILESESACYYSVSFKFENNDHIKFGSASLAAGNWEPVIIENEECNYIFNKTTSQNENIFPTVDYFTWKAMPPLKQIKYTHPTNVFCQDNLVLRFKYDNKPVCMGIFTIIDIEKQNANYFTSFDMNGFHIIGSWNPNQKNIPITDPTIVVGNEQPRPEVGTVLWEDETSHYEIKYVMINGSNLIMYSINNLQDPSDRHTWPLDIMYNGDENTILILQLPDNLELKNAVGMHMEQFERQHVLFPFVDSENKKNRQIIISDVPHEENNLVFIELAFLSDDHKYEITEIPLPNGEKYLSENSLDLDNIPPSLL